MASFKTARPAALDTHQWCLPMSFKLTGIFDFSSKQPGDLFDSPVSYPASVRTVGIWGNDFQPG